MDASTNELYNDILGTFPLDTKTPKYAYVQKIANRGVTFNCPVLKPIRTDSEPEQGDGMLKDNELYVPLIVVSVLAVVSTIVAIVIGVVLCCRNSQRI